MVAPWDVMGTKRSRSLTVGCHNGEGRTQLRVSIQQLYARSANASTQDVNDLPQSLQIIQ